MNSPKKAANLYRIWGLLCIIFLTLSSAAAQTVRIMPLGNSLTAGMTDAGSDPIGGYRDNLYDLLITEGVDFDFVGNQTDGSGFDADHEGHPGWPVDSINVYLDNWLAGHNPDIVLFMGGTNDVFEQRSLTEIVDNIETTLDKIYNYDPATKIVMSSIIPRRDALNDYTIEVNDELMNLYYEKLDAGYKIYYAGHFEMFTANPTWADDYMYPMDLIHPSNAGYEVMARMYFNMVMNAINETDPIVTDNFNRSTLGAVWDAAANYTISGNELTINASDTYWNYLATYKAITNPTQVEMTISNTASASENEYWGLAMMLDGPSKSAGGYFLRITSGGLNLWTLSNGTVYSEVGTVPIGGVTLQPGDKYRVAMSTDGLGHHFECYINGSYVGKISDPSKLKGNTDPYFAGVFMRGSQVSTVDNFDLFKSTDTEPPDAINDLTIGAVTASSIQLRWSATGDDGASGNASGYDIRYSTSIISESNFAQATQLANSIQPTGPGGAESFVVPGLETDTKYFFAIKVYDEAGNRSVISNVVSSSTSNALGMTDDFERAEVGPTWNAGTEFSIQNGALVNTSTDEEWTHIALYNQRKNPIEIGVIWDETADANGIDQGGLAIMMDGPDPATASGYLVWRRTAYQKIGVFQIVNGQLGDGGLYDALVATPPQPGDEWKVSIQTDQYGHHFSFYLNGTLDGTVTDAEKFQGNAEELYSGLVLHGNRNNNVEAFMMVNTVGAPTDLVYVSGNNQDGPVGKPLPSPLVAKVTDKDGMPVAGVKVDFLITEGGGHFDKEVASDGNIRIEGEAAELTSMYAEAEPLCSGEAYITGGNAGFREASVRFRFYIQEAGDYYIWARVNPMGNYQQNSWYWKFDGSQERIWDSRPIDADDWTWDTIGYRGDSERERNPDEPFFTYNFDVGWHTLTLLQMDKNTKLDKIVITNEISFNPSGKEEYPEYRTDGSGEVQAIWTLGSQFGTNNNRALAQSIGLNGSPIEFIASASGDVPSNITLVSGNEQSGAGGDKMPEPLKVRITDQYGNPNRNFPVTFTVTNGGGHMESEQPVYTDDDGYASDYVYLGTEDYTTTVEASAEYDGAALGGSPVTFTATATSKIAHELQILQGDNQNANVNQALPKPLEVKIIDNQDNAIAGHNVRFRVKKGSATLTGGVTDITKQTDANGKASVTVTTSTTVDSNEIEVTALKMGTNLIGSPHIFSSYSKPLSAAKMALHSGNNQTGATGSNLAEPLVVKVMDQYNNAVTGHSVTFSVTNGGGSIEGQASKSVPSDGQGLAAVTLTLGTDERDINRCVASSVKSGDGTPLEGSPVTFEAQAGKVSEMQLLSQNNLEGSAGYQLENPFVIKVLDNFGNPVPDFELEFHVTRGGGHISGATDTTIATGSNGLVAVTYTMGYTPGVENRIVVNGYRFGEPLTGNPITLKATAYNATDYQYENGSLGPKDFTNGVAGLPLPDSIKTRVIDSKGRSMKYYPVSYAITGGGGKINGQDSVQVQTNAAGLAAVEWTMGPLPGSFNNLMQGYAFFNGNPITHSPLKFRASARKGDPAIMVIASTDSQKSVVGSILQDPVKVRITDPAENPIIGHPVDFKITAGNGKINDAVTTSKQYTDGEGYAQVRWRIGNEQGWVNSMEVVSEFNDEHLTGSPYVFSAYGLPSQATTLVRVGQERINGTVGAPLSEPFQVKVTDDHNNGVADMQVTFEVLSGGGKFDGDSMKVVTSDENGLCAATLTLGPTVNVENAVKVTAFNGAIELTNSPMFFYSVGTPGPVDLDSSRIFIEPAILAAGETAAVTVVLSDAFGNPPSTSYWVSLEAEGEGAVITQQPSAVTDEYGRAFGSVRSTKAGIKLIRAQILSTQRDWLTNPGTVRFLPLVGTKIGNRTGNNQTGNVGAALAEPLGITVYDKFDNPVPDHEVTFTAEGNAAIYEPQPVYTDTAGNAYSHLILGDSPGTYSANVQAKDISTSRSYSANAVEGVARYVSIYSGDNQTGTAGVELTEPLVVQVTDASNRPVSNHSVKFSVEFGDGSFKGSAQIIVPTDAMGLAAVHYTLGKEVGLNFVRAESPELFATYGEFAKFTLHGNAGEAKVINMISGDGGSAPVYGSPSALIVSTTDFFGNGVGDVPVTYTVVSGDASIEQAQPVTSNADGYASSRVRFGGTVGPVEVEASSEGLVNSPIKFLVQVTAAGAVSMEMAGGNQQNGTISRQTPFPFEVLIKDTHGNPVPNSPIYWTVKSGNGSLVLGGGNSTTYSEEDGIARNYLILGPNVGENQVIAFNNSLSGSPLNFYANGVTNHFPLITEIEDIVANEQETIAFTVEATDDDNDVIAYGARGSTIPAGAVYDSLATHKFTWTPTYVQAGEYDVWFYVYDNRDGIGVERVNIRVNNLNRPPQMQARWPISREISGDRLTGQPVDFTISVTDADTDDELEYKWYLRDRYLLVPDSLLVSTTNEYHFQPTDYPVGGYEVSVIVSDGYDQLRHTWILSNKDAVELANFSATVQDFQGVRLNWETNYEHNNMGFNILRGNTKNGEYKRITKALVPANESRRYQFTDQEVEPGRKYFYRLEDVSFSGKKTLHPAIEIQLERPKDFELSQNFPNPFNPVTQIRFQLPEPTQVRLEIYNLLGQRVRTLVQDKLNPGYHLVMWDGRDENGAPVSSGIYFYHMRTEKFRQTKRMLLLK